MAIFSRTASELAAGEEMWTEVGRSLCTVSPDLVHEWATWTARNGRRVSDFISPLDKFFQGFVGLLTEFV
jgi:hypothetical protein